MFFEFYGLQDATLTYFCSSKRKGINFGNVFYWTDTTILLPRSEFLYSCTLCQSLESLSACCTVIMCDIAGIKVIAQEARTLPTGRYLLALFNRMAGQI
jgi:hypothetical protein